jgi:hypothetical protein
MTIHSNARSIGISAYPLMLEQCLWLAGERSGGRVAIRRSRGVSGRRTRLDEHPEAHRVWSEALWPSDYGGPGWPGYSGEARRALYHAADAPTAAMKSQRTWTPVGAERTRTPVTITARAIRSDGTAGKESPGGCPPARFCADSTSVSPPDASGSARPGPVASDTEAAVPTLTRTA